MSTLPWYIVTGVTTLPLFFIFPYGRYRSLHPTYVDPLMTKIGIGDLDGWSVCHFCWYGLMGYIFPTRTLEVMGLGATWEVIEWFLGETRPAILGGFGDCPHNINATNNEKWWYGRASDLVVNALGFFTARALFV